MNRRRRRVNRKNHLNLSGRASISATRPLFVRSARRFDKVSVRSARCRCGRAILPLGAGSKWLIQRGALLLGFLDWLRQLGKKLSRSDAISCSKLARAASRRIPTSDRVLLVASLRISPRYADKSLIYRTSTAAFRVGFLQPVSDLARSMLTEDFRIGLAASQAAQYVVGTSNPLQPNYVLEGSIDALYGDFRDLSAANGGARDGIFLVQQDRRRYRR